MNTTKSPVVKRSIVGGGHKTSVRAFSSEVDTGSREENASKQGARASFRFDRNGKGSSLEEPFWSGMKEISAQRGMTLSEVVSEIDKNRQQGNLSSAIRLFVLDHFKSRAGSSTGGSRLHSGHGQGVEASAVEGR